MLIRIIRVSLSPFSRSFANLWIVAPSSSSVGSVAQTTTDLSAAISFCSTMINVTSRTMYFEWLSIYFPPLRYFGNLFTSAFRHKTINGKAATDNRRILTKIPNKTWPRIFIWFGWRNVATKNSLQFLKRFTINLKCGHPHIFSRVSKGTFAFEKSCCPRDLRCLHGRWAYHRTEAQCQW